MSKHLPAPPPRPGKHKGEPAPITRREWALTAVGLSIISLALMLSALIPSGHPL